MIRAGRGGTVLIDSGDVGSGDTLQGYFRIQNIRKLDAVFLSHLHEDHANGLLELLKNEFPVAALYIPEIESGLGIEKEILALAQTQNIPILRLEAGAALTLGEMDYQVLWPRSDERKMDLNNESMVLRLNHGETSLLFTGDIEIPAAKILTEKAGEDLQADVLKVPHHGGSSSVQRAFIETCDPDWAVISAGVDNQYNVPTDKMLACLLKEEIGIWRTDRDGTVVLTLDTKGIRNIQRTNKWR